MRANLKKFRNLKRCAAHLCVVVVATGVAFLAGMSTLTTPATAAERIQITGEVVDTWCSISGIMFASGTAHHQCAVWCAVGGIPVSIKTDDGQHYVVLKVENDDDSVASPTLIKVQTHQVVVDGELHERDGVKYLFVSKVADDNGIVNLTHDDYGIVPFGE